MFPHIIMSCHVPSMSCHAMSCHVIPCPVMAWHAMSCQSAICEKQAHTLCIFKDGSSKAWECVDHVARRGVGGNCRPCGWAWTPGPCGWGCAGGQAGVPCGVAAASPPHWIAPQAPEHRAFPGLGAEALGREPGGRPPDHRRVCTTKTTATCTPDPLSSCLPPPPPLSLYAPPPIIHLTPFHIRTTTHTDPTRAQSSLIVGLATRRGGGGRRPTGDKGRAETLAWPTVGGPKEMSAP